MTTATSALSTTLRDAFNFEVVKLPMMAVNGANLLDSNDFGLYRNDDWTQVHSRTVKGTYRPHTTEQVIKACEVAESIFSECEARCYFNRGHYVQLTPSRDYRRSIFGTTDNVFPVLLIHAGYDMKAWVASLGVYRDTCMNMARLQSVSSTSVRIPHLSNLDDDIAEMTESFEVLESSWGDLVKFIGRMQATRTYMPGFLLQVFGPCPSSDDVTVRTINNYNDRERLIVKRIAAESVTTGRGLYNGDVSVWEAFNAVQGYYQHDAPRMGHRGSFARLLKANDSPYVKAAERVAVSLVG